MVINSSALVKTFALRVCAPETVASTFTRFGERVFSHILYQPNAFSTHTNDKWCQVASSVTSAHRQVCEGTSSRVRLLIIQETTDGILLFITALPCF